MPDDALPDPVDAAEALPRAHTLLPAGTAVADVIELAYADRLVRRKRLTSAGGLAFLVEFPRATELVEDAVLQVEGGPGIRILAAAEPLYEVRGALPRLAWHIGNRHAPCEVGTDRLRIARDPVLARMLEGLGAEVMEVSAPFRPEGGAYGHGRTFGHAHD